MFNEAQKDRTLKSPDGAPGIRMCGMMAYGEVHYFVDGFYRCRCGDVSRDYPFHIENTVRPTWSDVLRLHQILKIAPLE